MKLVVAWNAHAARRRTAIMVCAVVGAVAGSSRLGGAQQNTARPTPTPAVCARPSLAARIVRAVRGVVSPMAEQQGVYGSVDVLVSLDADSRIVATRIQRSPHALLNQPALVAARASSYQTEVKDCRTVASDVLYTVDFPEKITYATSPSGARTITIFADATVTRPADVAYVEVRITTVGEFAAPAMKQNDALFEALETKLRSVGMAERNVRATRSVRRIPSPVPVETPPLRPGDGYGYEAERQIAITVDAVNSAYDISVAAASVQHVAVLGTRYVLHDRAAAYREALDVALKDADTSAQRAVTPQHRILGPLQHVDNRPEERPTPSTEFVPFRPAATGAPASTVPTFDVRATAAVTYGIEP